LQARTFPSSFAADTGKKPKRNRALKLKLQGDKSSPEQAPVLAGAFAPTPKRR
jgi:hypothetical protein